MLQRLSIQDLAIIDHLTLDFAPGFTVLTGETGAGKSVILGALNLVLGERAGAEDIRTGCDLGVAEALFDAGRVPGVLALLREWGLLDGEDPADESPGPEEKRTEAAETAAVSRGRSAPESASHRHAADAANVELVLRREVTTQGRSRCLVNGRLVPLGQMRRIGDRLVDLHGQHQHQSLLQVEVHREILDEFGGESLGQALAAYAQLFAQRQDAVRSLRELDRDERELERRKDMLEYQIREIRSAAPLPGEDAALEEERLRLQHADALGRHTMGAHAALYEAVLGEPTVTDLLTQCEEMVGQAARLEPSLEDTGRRIAALRAETADVASVLRAYAESLENDPVRLAEVEDRVHVLRQLRRKYGATIEDVLAEAKRMETELHGLTHRDEERERLGAERARLERDLVKAADAVTALRRAAGERFARTLGRELKDLEMPDVRFEVRLASPEAACSAGVPPASGGAGVPPDDNILTWPDGRRRRLYPHGADEVEFLLSPNRGEEPRPLRRVASGGELSRIMLALKIVMRRLAQVPTLIFDEIDTGISGRTGTRIGQKMAALGEDCQVVCITHLPQIAARATAHYVVRKGVARGRTLTRVERLDAPADRALEIARLLGGQADSAIALRHAQELLAEGR